MAMKEQLHLAVDKSLKKRIEAAAGSAGFSVSLYVRMVLDQATRTPFLLKKRRSA